MRSPSLPAALPLPPSLESESSPNTSPLPLRVLTHNIRYATKSPFHGEKPWQQRAPLLLSQLLYHTRGLPNTILCFQEVLHGQLTYISSRLASSSASSETWAYVGVGRDDGATRGEYSPIFFRSDIFSIARQNQDNSPHCWETVWLSPTPEVPGSKGWDAASPRILTLALLVHRVSARRVLAATTHLDDQGAVARREAALLIRRVLCNRARDWAADACFLAGDLNSTADEERGAWAVLNETASGFMDIAGRDGGAQLQQSGRRYGNKATFTGFNGKGDGEKLKTIDFIHVGVMSELNPGAEATWTTTAEPNSEKSHDRGGAAVVIQGYAVLPNLFDDGVYISDHRAVVGDLLLPPPLGESTTR